MGAGRALACCRLPHRTREQKRKLRAAPVGRSPEGTALPTALDVSCRKSRAPSSADAPTPARRAGPGSRFAITVKVAWERREERASARKQHNQQ